MERKSERGSDLPHIVRSVKSSPTWYRSEVNPMGPSEKHLLAEGTHPFNPPMGADGRTLAETIFEQAMDSDEFNKIFTEPYRKVDFTEARRNIRERFGIGDRAFIDFSYSAHKLILDIVKMFPTTQRSAIYCVGPSFPGFANAVSSMFPEEKSDRFMKYMAVHTDWDAGPKDRIDKLLDIVPQRTEMLRKAIVLENPSNPMGQITGIDQIESLAEFCASRKILLIVDEAYGDAMDDRNSAIPLTEKFNSEIMVIRSFSKIAKFRGGMVAMSPLLKDAWQRVTVPMDTPPSTEILTNAMTKPEIIVPYSEMIRQKIAEVKAPLMEGLRDAGFVFPQTDDTVPIALIGVRRKESIGGGETRLIRNIYNVGMEMASGAGYRATSDWIDNGWARITVPKDAQKIPEIIGRLKIATMIA